MAINRPLPSPLPADLPEDWQEGQIVAPQGADVGLSEQHGYNYLMQQVNDAQRAVDQLGEDKQDKITGAEGQIVGFDENGDAVPQEPGVGRSMAGQTVEPTQGTTVTAGDGAEVFNDYRTRTYDGSNITTGNVACGAYSHAEGRFTTASGSDSHAEGYMTTSSGNNSHAEGNSTKATRSRSHAEGYSTEASGSASHAEGASTLASGAQAHAEGQGTTASENNSHAEGQGTKAIGLSSHAEGLFTSAGSNSSASNNRAQHAEGIMTSATGFDGAHAEGYETTASGTGSHAEGQGTTASNSYSHAEGKATTASGNFSHAEGSDTIAKGSSSHAAGVNTIANDYQTVVGTYNVEKPGGASSGDRFIVGGGWSSALKNAFRVSYNGSCYGSGAWNTSGADYAELFEWQDGNPNDEDRAGLFVTLDGDRIRIAAPKDDYILGIVSAVPSVVGDVYDDQWAGMYLRDVFGRTVIEEQDFPAETMEVPGEDGELETVEIHPAFRAPAPVVNPEYDHTEPYRPRTERPEWDAVGLLGKLVAVDDGTCQVNGWATVGVGGVATASPERTKYRVIARLDEAHIRVMIL